MSSVHKTATILLVFLCISVVSVKAEGGVYPAWYETTTYLNVRVSDNARARKITTLAPNTEIQVDYMTSNNWAAIRYGQQRGYVSAQYIRYVRDVEQVSSPPVSNCVSKTNGLWSWSWLFTIALWIIVFSIIRKIAIFVLGLMGMLMYRAYWLLCIPFYILNWLQRYLSKPWRLFYKSNSGKDQKNAELRDTYEWVKVPLYIILTPLRFVNAVYFNLIVHCSFEMYNYAIEIFLPSNNKEGGNDFSLLILLIPWRILKYVVWHGGLTIIESAIWTVVDTFVPALTLFHGTNENASTTITNAGRNGYSCNLTGIWNVGGGNYAGNGIYFAPARSTALHYACGSLIVCRVSLGNVLDLGLALWHVYRQCGYPNALGATKWGLQKGYVTGEWWRKDTGWWEYCMYDWQNRYNYSWRIRPLHVLNLNDKCMQRIPGGMCHWLFRQMVVEDIITYLEKEWG